MLLRRYCDTDNDNADEDYVEIEKILAECRRDPGLYDASSRRFETHFLHMLIRKIVYIFKKVFIFSQFWKSNTHQQRQRQTTMCVRSVYMHIFKYNYIYTNVLYTSFCIYISTIIWYSYPIYIQRNKQQQRALLWIPVQTTPHLKRGSYPTKHNPNLYERTSVCPTLSDH